MKFIKTIDEAADFIKEQNQLLLAKLDENIPAIKKLESYPKLPSVFGDALQYVDNQGNYHSYSYSRPHDCKTIEAVEKRRDSLINVVESVKDLIEPIRVRNAEIIEHNKKVVAKITAFMNTVGIPASFNYTDPKSRARNPKSISKQAGYKDDIGRNIATVDYAYTNIINSCKTKRNDIQNWSVKAINSLLEVEKMRKASETQQKLEKLIAVLKVKYDVEFDAEDVEVLDAIINRSKYLRLADAMFNARSDFSEHYRVSYALDAFKVENDTDQKIVDSLSEILDEYEGDGRIFRDCEWNYGAIMSYAPADIVNDYNNLKELIGD